MIILDTKDMSIYGKSHADMINKAIGTKMSYYFKSGVSLDRYQVFDTIAWFVMMDSSINGFGEDGLLWRNEISDDGKTIIERCVNPQNPKYYTKIRKEGFYPHRLAFRLDPHGAGDRYNCKFVGAFTLTEVLEPDFSAVKYTKVSDRFVLSYYGGDDKTMFTKSELYNTKIETLGFSDSTLKMLLNGNINKLGQLLEIGMYSAGPLVEEIYAKIYKKYGR